MDKDEAENTRIDNVNEPAQANIERPKHHHNIWLLSLVAVLAVGSLFVWTWYALEDNDQTISSFEECVEAGYPVAESYPEQCFVPDGPSFTRIVEE